MVSFVKEVNVHEALVHVEGLDARGAIGVRDAAVVVWEEDGKIEQRDQFSQNSTTGTTSGGLLGLLVEVLRGALGVLLR